VTWCTWRWSKCRNMQRSVLNSRKSRVLMNGISFIFNYVLHHEIQSSSLIKFYLATISLAKIMKSTGRRMNGSTIWNKCGRKSSWSNFRNMLTISVEVLWKSTINLPQYSWCSGRDCYRLSLECTSKSLLVEAPSLICPLWIIRARNAKK